MKYVWVIILCTIAWSCTPKPACYKESTKNKVIRWGTFYGQANRCEAHEMRSTAEVFEYSKTDLSDIKEIGQADVERYCNTINSVEKNLLRTQTYSTPGDTLLFIEYQNRDSGLQMRFSWNYTHVNDGNKYCLIALDSLNSLLSTVK